MSDFDLTEPIPEVVMKNYAHTTGPKFLVDLNGVKTEFAQSLRFERAEKFSDKLHAEINWVEKFTSHAPSVGTHYEKILSELTREVLPTSISLGTGFVYDSMTEQCSPQMDIIFYDETDVSPIHKRDDFVIVQPEQVLGVCEVKKRLQTNALTDWIEKTIGVNFGSRAGRYVNIQTGLLFAYSSDIKSETILRILSETIDSYLDHFHCKFKNGEDALLQLRKLCLPTVCIADRTEYFTASVDVVPSDKTTATISVSMNITNGPKGVGPYLMHLPRAKETSIFDRRDHISFALSKSVDKMEGQVTFSPQNEISSERLLSLFPDAHELLQFYNAIGAIHCSFYSPEAHSTLRDFCQTPGFYFKSMPYDPFDADQRAQHEDMHDQELQLVSPSSSS